MPNKPEHVSQVLRRVLEELARRQAENDNRRKGIKEAQGEAKERSSMSGWIC
ncbi:hypothetical protein D3C86_2175890 [compost metagenome]